jgi:hypothetical protein
MSGGQVTNGLYAYWPFNEGAGTVTTDASGGGNNGTLTNFNSTATSGWVTDSTVGGTVLSFDGVDDYVTVPYSSNLNLTTGVTLSAWVKTTQTNRGDIITRYKPASPFPGYGLVMDPGTPGCTTPGTIGMWVGDMTNYYVCSTAVVNDGNWHLVTGTYDGTTVKIYIHGKLLIKNTPEFGRMHFLPLYHPAAALYNGGMRETLIKDFKKIPKALEKINS